MVFAIHQHELATEIHVSPLFWIPHTSLSPHPSGLSQSTGFGCPTSSIELALVICFTYECECTCFNAILSDHPTLAFSHRVQKSVLYTCVSFVALHVGSLVPSFLVPYICALIYSICLFLSDISLCVIGSRFIHLIRTDSNHSFL